MIEERTANECVVFIFLRHMRLSSLRTFGAQREEMLRGENKSERERRIVQRPISLPHNISASSNCVYLLCLEDRIIVPKSAEVCFGGCISQGMLITGTKNL